MSASVTARVGAVKSSVGVGSVCVASVTGGSVSGTSVYRVSVSGGALASVVPLGAVAMISTPGSWKGSGAAAWEPPPKEASRRVTADTAAAAAVQKPRLT